MGASAVSSVMDVSKDAMADLFQDETEERGVGGPGSPMPPSQYAQQANAGYEIPARYYTILWVMKYIAEHPFRSAGYRGSHPLFLQICLEFVCKYHYFNTCNHVRRVDFISPVRVICQYL